ncbi:MAG: hypothetical protein J6S85_20420 [Methanobrevibacter sp.]|nr:hypothetical protein [Methanobrevibacter sp.]
MTPEEYIINRIQELEKNNRTLERFLSSANSRIAVLNNGNRKLLNILDFLFDKLEITYDNRTGLLEVGSDNLLVENEELEEYLKTREPRSEQALRENSYRSWSHNTLEKDPVTDIFNDIKEVEDE